MKLDSSSDIETATIELAETILRLALGQRNPAETAQANRVAGLISDPAAKRLSMAMTDRLIRSSSAVRASLCYRNLLSRFGIPQGFKWLDRAMLIAGGIASRMAPSLVLMSIISKLHSESKNVILSAEPALLANFLKKRKAEGVRVNLNQLGEAVLGEEEAMRRLESIESLLNRPDTEYVSVKISAIFSQINLLAWDNTLSEIKTRLRRLYRIALAKGKFVNLDMEEYRDLNLTVTAFREVLDERDFKQLYAGIALQAYLPDSAGVQRELTEWAKARIANGGMPIKIRLVKGANLAMESVDAELHGWYQAPYSQKSDTDANFRRMLEYASKPENAAAVRVGVGSHNLFDVALALVLRDVYQVQDAIEIEMLEGMANDLARIVRQKAGSLLVYSPIVHPKDFGSALAYLIRRLDENTTPENFLRDLFSLELGSVAWERQKQRFIQGWRERTTVSSNSHRSQKPERSYTKFTNEPDTDWTQAHNRSELSRTTEWLQNATDRPPQHNQLDQIESALEKARSSQPKWELLGADRRAAILMKCGDVLAAQRFRTIAILQAEAKKSIREADAEVSEAIDFARYYGTHNISATESRPLGLVVITPPWNFPFAIPCGGILAALMAGNSVILKPSPDSIETAWWLVQLLWEAGVQKDVLQFVACEDGPLGQKLICDPRTSAVVLTGSYETARMFQAWRPSLKLFAETSGKNAIVVSALADRDLAIKDIVHSAFGHSGQKCSAASLAILEAEVYDDPTFLRQLRDAAASLRVGDAKDPASVVTPLVCRPSPSLVRALTTLERGESWLLAPKRMVDQPANAIDVENQTVDPCLWSPGIRIGVKPGSWFHLTECFGPVLGLMRASDLDEAIRIQNAVPYGLTAGFHSLDELEISDWKDKVAAGNLYINRSITGAIVQRQPFGGWKRSSIGPGAKAGGPNYVNLFRRQNEAPIRDLLAAEASYRNAYHDYFSQSHDPTSLKCESNHFRYRPCRGVVLRLSEPDEQVETLARLAAELCKAPLEISLATKESDLDFAARLPSLAHRAEFLRTVSTPCDKVLSASYACEMNWIDAPFSLDGYVELTRWLREQSVTETRHRYGNIFG